MASCNICRSSLISSYQIISTECGHVFHKDCLDNWLQCYKICPNCHHKVHGGLRHLFLDFNERLKFNDTKAQTRHEMRQKKNSVRRKLIFTEEKHNLLEKDVKCFQQQLMKLKEDVDELEDTFEDFNEEMKDHKRSKLYDGKYLTMSSKTMLLLLRILLFITTVVVFFVTMDYEIFLISFIHELLTAGASFVVNKIIQRKKQIKFIFCN